MKQIYLFLFLIVGTTRVHTANICTMASTLRIVSQSDFDLTWAYAQEYCPKFIIRTPKFEEIQIKARAGIRLEGHLQSELIYCRKNKGQEVECNSQVIWKKDEERAKYQNFKSCGHYDFDVKENPDKSKKVEVYYDSPGRAGYGSHTVGYYKLIEEDDGDFLVLEHDYGSRLSALVYSGHGLSDLNCNMIFIDD